jgi:hypothetical protein
VPGIERPLLKKLAVDEEGLDEVGLLELLHRCPIPIKPPTGRRRHRSCHRCGSIAATCRRHMEVDFLDWYEASEVFSRGWASQAALAGNTRRHKKLAGCAFAFDLTFGCRVQPGSCFGHPLF